MPRSLRSLLVTTCCLLFATHAEPQVPNEIPYFKGTLEEAMEKAVQERRVLVVFMRGMNRPGEDAYDKVRSHTLLNRSLHQWISWHGILCEVSVEEQPELFSRIDSVASRGTAREFDMNRDPYFAVFIGTTKEAEFATLFPEPYLIPGFGDPLRGRYHWIPGIMGLVPPEEPLSDTSYIKPLELLFRLDYLLEARSIKEPVWGEWHKKLNPPPVAPAPVLLSSIEDPDAAPWPEPDQHPTLWTSLSLARDNASPAEGDQHLATGIYTWIWERGTDTPWLAPLRRTLIASEMTALAAARPGAKSRFTRMRDNASDRYAWADFIERWDWLILSEIVDDPFATLLEMDYSLNDPDEGSLATSTEQFGLRLLSQRAPWSDVWTVHADDVKRLDAIRALERQKPAPRATDEEWAELVAFRRAVLLSESCRIHIAYLRDRNDSQAMRIAADLIKSDTDGSARLALASMAWAAGLADERHLAWVNEAIALGADDRGLRDALNPTTTAKPPTTSD